MKILVTGGAGFIGSAVIRLIINETKHEVVNLDKLTYAGNYNWNRLLQFQIQNAILLSKLIFVMQQK